MKTAEALLRDALDLATLFHARARRKASGVPYIVHPLRVAARLGLWGIAADDHPVLWAAAYCHDLIEDCGLTHELIRAATNEQVADIVQELTFVPDDDPPMFGRGRAAKQDYMASFAVKRAASAVVKCADRWENTSDFLDEHLLTYVPYRCHAREYWEQAAPLRDAVEVVHRETIERNYGPTAFRRTLADNDRMARMLHGTYTGPA
jgi:(p)ppGpp synthase/HD superfamily hydrolase